MIDHLDKQTQPMDIEPKRGRGRPATGQALSNADRQRAYRERQKAQRNENEYNGMSKAYAAEIKALRKALEKAEDKTEQCRLIAVELGERCKRAEQRVKELEKELASRNGNEGEDSRGVWIVQVKHRGSRTWKECGSPEVGLETARKSVDYMQFKSGSGQGEEWRAIRADGMIYWPLWAKAKAPK